VLRRDRDLARTTRDRLTALTAPRAPAAGSDAGAGSGPAASPSAPPGWVPSLAVPPEPLPAIEVASAPPVEPPTRTTSALRVAAAGYTAAHGDPVARAPTPRRRIRWTVSWQVASAAGAVVLLVAGGVALRAASIAPGPAVVLPTPAPSRVAGPQPTTTTELVVDVVGAVAAPGVVRLPPGSRVVDAIAAAGGATADAQVSALNLARVLVDGEQIAVPRPGEQPASAGAATDGGADADQTVDLNTADIAALDALPGIGPVLAERIATHREDRPFASVDELADVAGIGPTLLERLRDRVRV